MATGSWSTLVDLASRQVNGKLVHIAEMLSQTISFTEDLTFQEANGVTLHEGVYRTSMPPGVWRSYNQGTPYGKTTTAKFRLGVGNLVQWSQVDAKLAEDSGDVEGYRLREDMGILQGMGQTIEGTIIYGNPNVIPQEFYGLSAFYNSLNADIATGGAQNGQNVLDAAGQGNSNLSIWLVGHSPRHFYGIYPRGSSAGLKMINRGDTVPAYDSVGNPFRAYTSMFEADMGIVPEDWRYIVRMANFDTTNAGLAGPNAPDIFAMMAQAAYLPETFGKKQSGITKADSPSDSSPAIRFVWYANRTARYHMDIQAIRGRQVLLSMNDYDGRVTDSWRSIPVKVSDQLINYEARVN